jgi:antitoxin component of MazEF toxin-antitoxin module
MTRWITISSRRGASPRNYDNYMETFFTTKVVKIGSSVGLVIPRDILAACMWERGDRVVFSVIAGPTLVIRQLSEQEIRRLKPATDIAY